MDTKKLRQKILDLAIRGKLVPQDPNDEPASVLLERIRAEKERLIAEGKIKRPKKSKTSSAESHYQNFETPFPIPESWEWCRIEDFAFVTKLAGFEYTNYISENITSSGEVPLFKGKNIKFESIEYVFESYIPTAVSNELERSQITKKCLLTPYVGAIGNIGIHDKDGLFHLGSNVGKIEIFNDIQPLVLEEYLRYYLMSSNGYKELTKHKKATAQESISIEAIRDVIVPICSISEQKRIVNEIERIYSLIELIIDSENELKNNISQVKSKILDLAMRGKLVPQDPADEPAADLLRRINPKAKIITDNQHYPQLPNNWVLTKIGEVVNIVNGKSYKDIENPSGAYPIYGSGGIIGMADSYSCLAGSTIIGRKGTINNPLLINTNFWNVDTAFGMKPCGAILDLFFYYFCKSTDFTALDKGSTLPSLTKSAIENIEIPLPPIAEQQRIVEKIKSYENLFQSILSLI